MPLTILVIACMWMGQATTVAGITGVKLRMDWNPSSCAPPAASECAQAPIDAFTMSQLQPTPPSDCPTAPPLMTDSAFMADVPLDVQRQLNCTYEDTNAPLGTSNGILWQSTWRGGGHCTGLTIGNFFRTFQNLYTQFNPNRVLAENQWKPPSIDAGLFRSKMSEKVGKAITLECDADTRRLINVVVCLTPAAPYEPVDCPPDLEDPICHFGILSLPSTSAESRPAAVKVPDECMSYVRPYYELPIDPTPSPPVDPATPSPPVNPVTPTPPSPVGEEGSSSSNMGLIIGAAVGGVAVVAAIVAGIVFYRRKGRNNAAPDTPNTAWRLESTPSNVQALPPQAPLVVIEPINESGYMYATSPPNGNSLNPAAGFRGAALAGGTAVARDVNAHPLNSQRSGSESSLRQHLSSTSPTSPFVMSGATAGSIDPLLQYIKSTTTLQSQSSRGSLAAWELRFDDLILEQPIGEGSFGRVYRGNWNQTQVAVKILMDLGGSADGNAAQSALISAGDPSMQRLAQEASLMSQLHHPNIVQFLGVTMQPAAVVTEYCVRGSLIAVIQAAKNSPERCAELDWTRRMKFAADCARGMLYLHSRTPAVLHRDLKSANVLITGAWKAKCADFGLSKVLEDTTRSTSLQAMNPRWLAPEVLKGSPASAASDVFAFGVIMWELLTWALPWGTTNPWNIVSSVVAGGRLAIPSPNELPGPNNPGSWPLLGRYMALMQRCWAQEPAERPTFSEVMQELRDMEPAVDVEM